MTHSPAVHSDFFSHMVSNHALFDEYCYCDWDENHVCLMVNFAPFQPFYPSGPVPMSQFLVLGIFSLFQLQITTVVDADVTLLRLLWMHPLLT